MITMLCVGDMEKSLIQCTKTQLHPPHFSLEYSSHPSDALDRMKNTSFDVVLSEYHFPDVSGIEFLTQVRSLYGDIPFILYTGKEPELVVKTALSYGADYCITDYTNLPLEYVRLLQIITRLVESRVDKQALQDSIAQLYHAEYVAGLGHWSFHPETGVMTASLAARNIYGLDDREITFDDLKRIIVPEYWSYLSDSFHELIRVKGSSEVEYQIKRLHDGSIIDVYAIAEYDPVENKVFGVVQDITGRKSIERALSLSESKFRLLVENVNDVIFSVDTRGRIIYFSPAGTRLFGYSSSDLAGRLFLDVVYPEDRPSILKRFEELGKGVLTPMEWRFVKKDGSLCWVRTSTRPVTDTGGHPRFFGVITDISPEKEAEQAIRESEEKYRFLVDHSFEGILILDLQGKILFANQAAMQIVGIDEFSLLAEKNVLEYIAPESLETVISDLKRVSERHDPFAAEYQVLSRSGGKVWVECIGKLIRYQGKDADLLSIRDITERRKAEEELRASEGRFRTFVEHAYDIVFSLTPDGIVTYTSPNWGEMLGFSDKNIRGMTIQDLIHPDDVPRATQGLLDIRNSRRKGGGMEYRVRHKDGSWKWHFSNVNPIYYPDGSLQAYVGIAHDITERKQSEMALRKANRQLNLLSSITRHDILNQVMTTFAYLDSAKLGKTNDDMNALIEKIENCTSRIQSHIEFTKTYEGLGFNEPEWQVLVDCIPQNNVPISLSLEIQPSHLQIFADSMLKKVFYNLLDNSLRHGERVQKVTVKTIQDQDALLVIFSDDGTGIPDEEKERIFDRGYGKNTGLGLFLVRDILSLTAITIQENGEEGKGAQFEMRIPKDAWRVV